MTCLILYIYLYIYLVANCVIRLQACMLSILDHCQPYLDREFLHTSALFRIKLYDSINSINPPLCKSHLHKNHNNGPPPHPKLPPPQSHAIHPPSLLLRKPPIPLLKPYNYPPTGTSPTWCESDTSPPETWEMVTVAITYGHIHLLSYLLTLYSRGGGGIEYIPVIEAILNNPDVRVMAPIHNHSPRSIHYIFDPGLSTACRQCQYRHSPILSCPKCFRLFITC